MRGKKQAQRQFVAMIDVNARIPEHHPIREIKRLSDEVFSRFAPALRGDVQRDRPALHPAGTLALARGS